ncbi:cytotoxic and regulatory T-cell molecule isoform X2 [Leucoraja erinacea]|uniref:cytotoxic and regulatory T-cell molecule isoform X2 n=1 Tax=Leucoraja erinaceus TaxID=7782 RepID=UPI002457A7D4|nr:cytotoxic and regulatory T-cell molecule isoform X2 [Leucoraja erinacea]
MAILSVLCFLVFAALQANSQSLQWKFITVLEGNSAVLNCTMKKSEGSYIEWKNPKQQVLYFNKKKELRDHRFKLVNYSTSQLIITLRDTTVDDDGIYSCLYYAHKIIKKQVHLTVLAPPSNPMLSVSKRSLKEKVVRCITKGSKPKPQVTWLLNNRVELHGRTKYKQENNSAKYTTISILKLKRHNKNSRIDCLVRHEALMNRILRATYRFDNNYNLFEPTESYAQTTTSDVATTSPEPTMDSEQPDLDKEDFYTRETPKTKLENDTTLNASSTPIMELPITEIQKSTFKTKAGSFIGYGSTPLNSNENSTERNERTTFNSTITWNKANTSSIDSEKTLTIKCHSNLTIENNGKYEKQQMKKNGALLLILVSFLICALFIIFQLFVLKLWKQHLKWKKQKDESDITGESNKSNKSSNEENVRAENDNQDSNLQTQYIVHTNSEERVKQYCNDIPEDQTQESTV